MTLAPTSDRSGPPLDKPWPCRLYRIVVVDPHKRGLGPACGWIGETSRTPLDRIGEHFGDKDWRHEILAVEVDPTVFASKRAVQRAEEIATKTGRWGLPWDPVTGKAVNPAPDTTPHGTALRVDPRPIYPVENNRGNPWRIPPFKANQSARPAKRVVAKTPARRTQARQPVVARTRRLPVAALGYPLLWSACFAVVWWLACIPAAVDAGEGVWPGLIAACLVTGAAMGRRR